MSKFPVLTKVKWAVIGVVLIIYPLIASPFFVFQIGSQALILGTIALSLSFLAGQGGIVSLSQMTVAGVAGYAVAILGMSEATNASLHLGFPWWAAISIAITIATLAAIGIGALAGRTEGVYTIIITLAVGVAFYYFAQQNLEVFNGFQGISQVAAPVVGKSSLRSPVPFFYLCLVVAALSFGGITYLLRTPFGLALQGTRDNARRMKALGFNVAKHRLASHAVAGFIAAVAGVLWVWYQGRISPGTVGIGAMINILIIAVLGGISKPVGVYIGALVFVFLQNFAIDLFSRERFNLVIGIVFLIIVLFSPDGLIGLWKGLRVQWLNKRKKSSNI